MTQTTEIETSVDIVKQIDALLTGPGVTPLTFDDCAIVLRYDSRKTIERIVAGQAGRKLRAITVGDGTRRVLRSDLIAYIEAGVGAAPETVDPTVVVAGTERAVTVVPARRHRR